MQAPASPARLAVPGLAVLALAACGGDAPSALEPGGLGAARVERLWWLLFWVAAVVCAVVIGLLVAALVFRRGERVRVRQGRGADRFVVVAGFVLPAVVLVAVFAVSVADQAELAEPPTPPVATVEVEGRRWWWEVTYPEAGFTTANEIHVPVGQTVRVLLTTPVMNHSFWVPELMPKTDLVAGRVNETWLHADRAGVYWGQCAEYCGEQHAGMMFQVVAEPPELFALWLADQASPAEEPRTELAAVGKAAFLANACAACHTVRGTPADGELGPDLTHFGSRLRLGAGVAPNTPGHLGGWISNSQTLKPGNLMPPQPLEPLELRGLIAYLETLR